MSLSNWYNRTLNQIWGFVEDRTAMRKWALKPQPEFTFKPSYWTGAFVAVALVLPGHLGRAPPPLLPAHRPTRP